MSDVGREPSRCAASVSVAFGWVVYALWAALFIYYAVAWITNGRTPFAVGVMIVTFCGALAGAAVAVTLCVRDLRRQTMLSPQERRTWVEALIALNLVAIPIYWHRYMRPGRGGVAARSTTH